MLDSIFIPRRYGEDAVRRNNRLRGLEFIGTPEFDRIFDDLFKGIDMEKILRKHLQPVDRPKVSVKIDDDGETNQKLKDDFKWKVEDDEDGLDEGDAYEDEEPAKVPPSIFEMLKSGKEFKDIVPTQPKHTEIYNQAFGLDDEGNEIDLSDEDDEDDSEEEVPEVKNPYVFIANRLTFLIKTSQPIIWDTSTVATPSEDCIFVAFDKTKNPKLDMRLAAKIAHKVNMDMDIQDEIEEYLDGTKWETIYCAPHIMNLNGEDRLGFVFAVTSREDD